MSSLLSLLLLFFGCLTFRQHANLSSRSTYTDVRAATLRSCWSALLYHPVTIYRYWAGLAISPTYSIPILGRCCYLIQSQYTDTRPALLSQPFTVYRYWAGLAISPSHSILPMGRPCYFTHLQNTDTALLSPQSQYTDTGPALLSHPFSVYRYWAGLVISLIHSIPILGRPLLSHPFTVYRYWAGLAISPSHSIPIHYHVARTLSNQPINKS